GLGHVGTDKVVGSKSALAMFSEGTKRSRQWKLTYVLANMHATCDEAGTGKGAPMRPGSHRASSRPYQRTRGSLFSLKGAEAREAESSGWRKFASADCPSPCQLTRTLPPLVLCFSKPRYHGAPTAYYPIRSAAHKSDRHRGVPSLPSGRPKRRG